MKKIWKISGVIGGILLLAVIVIFFPMISLKTLGMKTMTGNYVTVYYEKEAAAAADVFALAEERAEELAALLEIEEPGNLPIYIYDSQEIMQTKKYGLIALLLDLDWYIGDNVGTSVLLTSPANPGPVHTYENNKNAVLHEMVHAYNHMLNPHMTYWIDNGAAGYLSEQIPERHLYNICEAPDLEQTQVKGLLAPVKFAEFNGYSFSYTYVEYLAETYSWEKVSQFLKTGDYEKCFGCSEEEIYDAWIIYLQQYYF